MMSQKQKKFARQAKQEAHTVYTVLAGAFMDEDYDAVIDAIESGQHVFNTLADEVYEFELIGPVACKWCGEADNSKGEHGLGSCVPVEREETAFLKRQVLGALPGEEN